MTIECILLAGADEATAGDLAPLLAAHRYDVLLAASAEEALQALSEAPCDLALIGSDLPPRGGLDMVDLLARLHPRVPAVLLGAPEALNRYRAEELAACFQVLPQPVGPGRLLLVISQAAEIKRLREENRVLRGQWEEDENPDDLVPCSPQMVELLRQAATAGVTDDPVVLYGAPGTETHLVALYIHRCGARARGPFVRFDCGRLGGVAEAAELFGRHYAGPAGAVWRRSGRLKLAADGTLFLNNVRGLSDPCQARLLRFLEEGRFTAVGTDGAPRRLDVRIICASSCPLDRDNGFRKDLLYRLSALPLVIPPLSDRPRDVLPLARRLLRRFAREAGKDICDISREAEQALREYDWPGNLEELKVTVRSAVAVARHRMLRPEDMLCGPSSHPAAPRGEKAAHGLGVRRTLRAHTTSAITRATANGEEE